MLIPLLAWFAPIFMAFEALQLVVAERYLGIKQIEKGTDPRQLPMSEPLAAAWVLSTGVYAGWLGLMLLHPFGRAQVLSIIAVWFLGYGLRRNCRLKWALVTLTLEGAIRLGMLFSICGLIWRQI